MSSAAAGVAPESAVPVIAERNATLDRLRGIAILLVVLGHVVIYTYGMSAGGGGGGNAGLVRNLIYGFHMPLFIALSGFVVFGRLGTSPVAWIEKRAVRLLVPYAAWFMLPALLGRGGGGPGLSGYLIGIARRAGLALSHPEQGLWFLPVLFLCSVVLVLVFQRWKGIATVVAFMAVWLVVALALWAWPVTGFGLLLFKDLAPYFIGGYLVAATSSRLPWRTFAYVGAVGFVVAVITGATPTVWGLTGVPALYALRPVGQVLYALAGISFSFVLAEFIRGLPGRALAYLGRHTMEIYVVQAFILGVWATTLGRALPGGLLPVLGVTVATVGVSLLIARVLSMWAPTALLFLGSRRRA